MTNFKMILKFQISFFLFAFFYRMVNSHQFVTTTNIDTMPMYEMKIIHMTSHLLFEQISELEGQESEWLAELKGFEDEVEACRKLFLMSNRKVTQDDFHPVDYYHRFKRFVVYKNILKTVRRKIKAENTEEIKMIPGSAEFDAAKEALIRLRSAYLLPLDELINGTVTIKDRETGSERTFQSLPLTANDCYFIADYSSQFPEFNTETILWAEAAVRLTDEGRIDIDELMRANHSLPGSEEKHRREFKASALLALAKALRESLYNTEALKVLKQAIEIFPIASMFLQEVEYQQAIWEGSNFVRPKNLGYEKHDLDELRSSVDVYKSDVYRALCRGEPYKTPSELSDLKCFYLRPSTIKDPFYKLWKVKVEEASKLPHVVQIYDIISDDEITVLKRFGDESFRVEALQFGKKDAHYRVVNKAWAEDHDDPVFSRLSRRVAAITGLNADPYSAENLQLANYMLGGHYASHSDYHAFKIRVVAPSSEHIKGNRIATLMFYLSDVTAGGATVFPRAGVALWPRKGSAAFWYNLRSDNQGDEDTFHGGCPVLIGSKWVANKWIRYNNQAFKKPCGLQPEQFLVVEDGHH